MKVTYSFGGVPGVINPVARISITNTGKAQKPARRHDILVLDCSQSMSGSIDDIRNDSQQYVNDLSSTDFVSVIIFSGHGTARRIAGPTQMNAIGKRLVSEAIKKHVRLIGTTVFSEPLLLALETAWDAAGEDLLHHAILFTDGNSVPTKWSVDTEKQKAIAQAINLGTSGAFLSCIGYGFYYDPTFLRELTGANGGSGVYLHISEIESFKDAIQAIKSVAEKIIPVAIELTVSGDKGAAARAYRTTPEVISVGSGGKIHLSALYENSAEIFVELSVAAKSARVECNVNGVHVDVHTDTFTQNDQANFIRVLGIEAFVSGDLYSAEQMFEQTGDSALADNIGGAYSTRDVREAGNAVRAYFRDRKFIGSGLKATGPNHNVLNVLRCIIEDPQNVVTIPAGAYKRSGVAVSDPRVIDNPLGKTLQVVGYVSNQERFNFSLRTLKPVLVRPKGGTGRPTPMQVWRKFNLILDGNLRIPELLGSLGEPSFNELQAAGVVGSDQVWQQGKSYTLNFRHLKMTSPAWANPTTLRLIDLLKEEADLEVMQTALNARKKALGTAGMNTQEDAEDSPVYRESAEPVKGLSLEYYDAPCCEYRLMGYKAKGFDASGLDFSEANRAVKEVRQKLIVVRFKLRAIVFSMEATKSRVIKWGSGKTTSLGKSPKLEQIASFQGATLKRVTWTEQHVCS